MKPFTLASAARFLIIRRAECGVVFHNAREVYQKAFKAGERRHKLAAITETKTGVPRKKFGK